MTSAEYISHFKVLGKIARIFDDGSQDIPTMKTLISRTFDQMATGESDSYGAMLSLGSFALKLDQAIQVGANDVQAVARDMATAYLMAVLVNDLTTVPAFSTHAQFVVDALQIEMGGAVDNVTFTDKTGTGLVNFFDTNFTLTGNWNTASDATANYKDSIYVVPDIV